MRRLMLVFCALLALPVLAEEPQVLVETSLQPAEGVVVGGTVRLQVDVLVDTWFLQAPQLPILELPGAVVTPPASDSLNLTVTRQGKTFFGLRFSYLIIPQQVQTYSIPALTIAVNPGQASAPMKVQSTAQAFSARQPSGFAAGQAVLVAQAVRLSQQVRYSSTASKVGDTVTREVTLQADGAQSMLLPKTVLGDVDGLKRYAQTPRISPLSDGRGGSSGGQRIDSASYRIEHAGHFNLPALQVRWWDSTANEARTANLPAISFEASANVDYRPPFSITADLQALGQRTRVHLARHWLMLAGGLIALGLLAWLGRPLYQRLRSAWQRRRAQRQARWLASAEYAWQQVPGQLDARPAELTALYLWARRKQQALGLLELPLPAPLAKRLLGFLNARYGREAVQEPALQQCKQSLPELRQGIDQVQPQRPQAHGLRPLNPNSTTIREDRP
ncbi:BatD family protein [Pseudomonas akapageensis]|uniref:BatD family protein n=1 Tax=Pseudomonas akapageensis TaxID=2609961 RepID=UPI00140BBECC|nr:BatD family protein [Pseudomonas akapageensis]